MFLNREPQDPLSQTKSSAEPKHKIDTSDQLNVSIESRVSENSV